MNNNYTKLINGQIITPSGILFGHTLIVCNGKIAEITKQNTDIPQAETIDARGNYIAPGCIDIHLHGGNGHDFTEGTPEAFYSIAQAHARHGMTAIYATLAASPRSVFEQAIQACETVMNDPKDGARIMGLHLEGNYLNKVMCGGQNPDYLYDPDPEEYQELLSSTHCIKRWSASPELPGALDFARYATRQGVLVSLAHTTAHYPIVKAAFEAGYTHVTHFYNAMTGVHKKREFKEEGTIESIYLLDDMTVELVADGIHVPPVIMRLVHKVKGVERIALVTDSMFAAAYDGSVEDIDSRVIVEDGVGKLADRSALASSIATADRLIRVMVQQAEIPLVDAVRMASETPAKIMRIDDRKGSLEKNKDADIIIFDSDIHVSTTIIEGRIVHKSENV
ncbi:N-acetylglucosamine-6-phosphate deacetylase [Parabacteroides sp. PF5-5]|uniref:N-acetylglucosamine-6-phosphate deacetylase n=1 Tax=unclassified Parabacteroides TaxID=2649774 RepID=UPI002476D705|nr:MULTISPECIES: N-acetylglucosamine-6-phosphate deacetylase [unclassified Parabacteroides]MDH6306247.1 N-acetylglucosamine-6-phosphate deacetylase [Parabacteroides sp. PH5-39]MDH6316961.1 N-acetylglucosamine-6-phosphate deacetylase [Parabacteroides sp. PF5-13]MDH6321031.1 N-acetylglucosamine-6-phosphate deacetylase [Parabacteroides sp. PH5-13]MDH6324763.1 N-acetylglucosamine-6-phosphate deacetylase [Parabacteroides sp. PH5-8]MDH6328146.1 N-acetylglucosamine-6-phosphate deacetylase [Parabacter